MSKYAPSASGFATANATLFSKSPMDLLLDEYMSELALADEAA